jgi:hypothetical protein
MLWNAQKKYDPYKIEGYGSRRPDTYGSGRYKTTIQMLQYKLQMLRIRKIFVRIRDPLCWWILYIVPLFQK